MKKDASGLLEDIALRLKASLESDGVEGFEMFDAYFHASEHPGLPEKSVRAYRLGFVIQNDGFALVRALIREILRRVDWITILRINMTPVPSIKRYAISIAFLLYDLSVIFKSSIALKALTKDRKAVAESLIEGFKSLKKDASKDMVSDLNQYISTTVWGDGDEVESRVGKLKQKDLHLLDDYRILVEMENFEKAIWNSIDDWIQVESKDSTGRHKGICLYFPVLTDGMVQMGRDEVVDYTPGGPPKSLDPRILFKVLSDENANFSLKYAALNALNTIRTGEARDLAAAAEDKFRSKLEQQLDKELAKGPKPGPGLKAAEEKIPKEPVYESEILDETEHITNQKRFELWSGKGNLYATARYRIDGHRNRSWDEIVETGHWFYSTESFAGAIHYYEKAVSLGCRDGIVHYRLGVCLNRIYGPDEGPGYFLSALNLLAERYEKCPYTLEAARALGEIEDKAGRKKEALGYYKKAIAGDAHNWYAFTAWMRLDDMKWLYDREPSKIPVLELGDISPFPIPPPPILAQLKIPDQRRKALISAQDELGNIKIPSQWKFVLDELAREIVKKGDTDLRWSCAMAFSRAAYQKRIQKASHIKALLKACDDSNDAVAEISCGALFEAAKGGLDLSPYAEMILANLESQYYPVKCYSMGALGFIGGDLSGTVPYILEFGSRKPMMRDLHLDPADKATVALALLSSAEPENGKALVKAMKDGLKSYMDDVYIWFVILGHARAGFDITPFHDILISGFDQKSRELKVVQGSAWAFYLAARAGKNIDVALPYLEKLLADKKPTLKTHAALAVTMNHLVSGKEESAQKYLKSKTAPVKRGAAFAFMDKYLMDNNTDGILELLSDNEDVMWGMASALDHVDEIYFWAHEHGLRPASEWFNAQMQAGTSVYTALSKSDEDKRKMWDAVWELQHSMKK